ncbi:MAG: glycosyltransferase, partial [Bacteroidaceae bacterium]
ELEELLSSIAKQTYTDFEVIVVEDGSAISSQEVVKKFDRLFSLHYHYKANSGPGDSRNIGATLAHGEYLIILDSDVILPEKYLQTIHNFLSHTPIDAFGGPDASHPDFTPIQRAISYSMTSIFTTGGIRGGRKKSMDKFYPRSFNMGIRKEVYNTLGGFAKMRFGEDVDFSLRIIEAGYSTSLISDAWVYHKRRSTFKQFFKQVHNSGIARINLMKRHPGSLKLVHTLPACFTLGVIGLVTLAVLIATCYSQEIALIILSPLVLYSLILWIDATFKEKSIWIGFLSIIASFIQLMGYGSGFIRSWYKRILLGQDEFQAFKKNFYK